MKTSIELQGTQQLALSVQAVQAIQLLQISAADLEHEIADALAQNPLLERPESEPDAAADEASATGTESTADDAAADDPWVGSARHAPEGEQEPGDTRAAPGSLRDHLIEQLAGSRLAPLERLLVETVIEGLDDDGYLRQSVDELRAVLPAQLGAGSAQMQFAIHYVQSLDPPGVAARSLGECLALQLARLPEGAGADAQARALALVIAREHLDLLARHDAPKLAQVLGCDIEAAHRANLLIRSLNPRPGAAFSVVETRYVIADVLVRKTNGRWVAVINPQAVPRLRIDRLLAQTVRRDGAQRQFAQHLREARALIHGVQQRFETIRRVAQAIVERQPLYFELGDMALRPLVLRDIAHALGIHQSTVSRASCNKYARTPFGVIELKRFFSVRASHADEGAGCSSAAIRVLIDELIGSEDPHAPLSDVQLAHLLASRGLRVARRTVAKHRAALGVAAVESRRLSAAGELGPRASNARPIAALAFERRAQRSRAAC